MRTRFIVSVALLAAGALLQTTAHAQDKKEVPFSAPSGTVETPAGKFSFPVGYPSKETSAKLYDELDYQRAVQAYIWATPLVNSVALKKGLTDAGVSPTEPSLLVFDKRVGPKQIIMTANSEVIYAFSVLDLSKTGPVLVEVPAGLPGGFW